METGEALELLRRAVAQEGSQAAVGRRLGYSAAAVNQALHGSYGGKLDVFFAKVEEIYSDKTVECQVLGEISLSRCAEERRRPFSASNPFRVKLYRACKQCLRNV